MLASASHTSCLPVFSSKSFIILHFLFRCETYLQWIVSHFVKMGECSFFFPLQRYTVDTARVIKKTIFSPPNCKGICIISHHVRACAFLDSLVYSISLFILAPIIQCLHYNFLLTNSSQNRALQVCFSSSRIIGSFSPFTFPYTFQNELVNFQKSCCVFLNVIKLN